MQTLINPPVENGPNQEASKQKHKLLEFDAQVTRRPSSLLRWRKKSIVSEFTHWSISKASKTNRQDIALTCSLTGA